MGDLITRINKMCITIYLDIVFNYGQSLCQCRLSINVSTALQRVNIVPTGCCKRPHDHIRNECFLWLDSSERRHSDNYSNNSEEFRRGWHPQCVMYIVHSIPIHNGIYKNYDQLPIDNLMKTNWANERFFPASITYLNRIHNAH